MPDSVSAVSCFSIQVPHKAGQGASVLSALWEAGINLTALWAYPVRGKKAQIDIVPADAKAFAKAAKKTGLPLVGPKKTVLLVRGGDRPGALAQAAAKLGAAGITIHACQAIAASAGEFAAVIQVSDENLKAAKKALSR